MKFKDAGSSDHPAGSSAHGGMLYYSIRFDSIRFGSIGALDIPHTLFYIIHYIPNPDHHRQPVLEKDNQNPMDMLEEGCHLNTDCGGLA